MRIASPQVSERGDDVGREVDGDVSWQFDHEPSPFIKESRESLDRRGHDSWVVAGAGVEPAKAGV